MTEDPVDQLLDELWRLVLAEEADEDSARSAARADRALLASARQRAVEQQQRNAAAAASPDATRRDRRRAASDAETYTAIVALCDGVLAGVTDAAAVAPPALAAHGSPTAAPVVLGLPLIAVHVIVRHGATTWIRTVQFTHVPRPGDRLDIPPVSVIAEDVVWSLDANDVAVPAVRCRAGERQTRAHFSDYGWSPSATVE